MPPPLARFGADRIGHYTAHVGNRAGHVATVSLARTGDDGIAGLHPIVNAVGNRELALIKTEGSRRILFNGVVAYPNRCPADSLRPLLPPQPKPLQGAGEILSFIDFLMFRRLAVKYWPWWG